MLTQQSIGDMSLDDLEDFWAALNEAGFDRILVRKIIDSRGRGNAMARAMYASIAEVEKGKIDHRFRFVREVGLEVPPHYRHEKQLRRYGKNHGKIIHGYDEVSDSHFSRVNVRLAPGQKFKVKIFAVLEHVSSITCLDFLKSQDASLVGAQGLTLFCEHSCHPDKAKAYYHKRLLSFVEKESLDDDQRYLVANPMMVCTGYELLDFVTSWRLGDYVLCFVKDE